MLIHMLSSEPVKIQSFLGVKIKLFLRLLTHFTPAAVQHDILSIFISADLEGTIKLY